MKRHILLIGLLVVVLSSPTGAQATLMSLDDAQFGQGSFTLDTATGLEWLDLSQTLGQSMDSIKANSGIGGVYDGLRYATSDEVAALYADAGLSSATIAQSYDLIINLTDLIGYAPAPYSSGADRWVMGITGTGPDQFDHFVSSYLQTVTEPGTGTSIGLYNLGYTVDGSSFLSSSQNADLGSFLVREEPPVVTPEPSTLLLLGGGLAGACLLRRKIAC